ncbi:translocation/assembly module TamB domain-containing protein [Haliea sp. E1-2-M8]|uniref:translocation/assembly module TamB domain-containing protein n=1 Tax=Haliea sp. E1-2-M8 TaxID=3064706 RepID=UPI0027203BDC|nr:translocation/assembly module TamB domain-containing protein [Haliea sp. E1-2-M8]MDO8862864.1 translocation/assembly module TamB domain-containing protein [Haliea sp. E1-2-M8]
MKRLAQGIVLLLVLLLALLAAAPFTAPGTRLLLALVPSSVPLQVEYESGRLAGELRLRRLVLATEGFELELKDLHMELERGCLWQSRFCFTRLDLGSLAFAVVPAEGEETDTAPTASEPLELPVSVVAPRVRIAALQVRWPGGSWEQQQASLAVQVDESGIVLDEVAVAGGLLTLEADPEVAPSATPEPLLLPEIGLPLLLVVESLELQAPRLRLGEIEHGLERLALALSWQGTELTLARLEADSAEWGSLSAEGELDLAGAWPMGLQLDARPANAVLPEALQGRSLQLGLNGPADALVIALTVPGEPALELSADANLLDPALPFAAEARILGPAGFALAQLPGWPPELADASLTLPLVVAAEGNLQAQTITLQAELVDAGYPLLAVRLAAAHSNGSVEVQELRITDVAGEGRVNLAGTLAYGDPLRWQATLESPGMVLPALNDYLFGTLQGRLATTGTLVDGHWQATLDEVAISGEINGLPATLSGDLALAAGSYITAGELLGEANGARLRLHGGSGSETDAVVELAIADLGRWQRSSRGSAQLRGEWRAEDARVDLQGSLSGVRWDNNRIDEGTLSGQLELGASGVLDAELSLQQVTVVEVFLGTVAAQVTGTREEPRLVLSSGGRLAGELQLAARQEGDSWTVQVNTDGVQTPLGPLTLETPFTVRYGPDGSSMEAHCWRLPESTLCASEWILGASGGGTAALDGDLALFGALLPQQLQVAGPLTASVRAEWQPDSALRATAQILSPEGTITQFYPEGESATLSWDSLTANLEQGADGLVLDAAMQREGARVISLAVRLPGDRAGALEGSLDLEQLQLAALRPFLPQLSRLEGEVSGALRLAGTQAEPEVLGELKWSGGALEAHANPTELRAVELTVNLFGERAELAGTARLGGGELAISGDASLRPEFALSLVLRGENNRLLYPPSTEAVVSPDLRLRATADGVVVGGEVLVKSGILAYEQLPAGSVSLSPDVVEVDYAGNVVAPESPFNLDAEVRVRIRDKFRVQGRDLNVTVGGDLSLQQVSGQPLQVFGNLNIVGGEFRAYGQRLLVRQGRISFTGLPENPDLNLRAEREIPADEVRAGVMVSGTLEEPRITLYSDPALSQTETLSYLVRGRGMDSGAGADGTAMALSVGTGLVNQSGIVEGLNSLPGLRNVEFGAEGSEDETAATVSGYIGERIYLSYGVGLYEPVNTLTARLYLQARLWLEVVSRLESSVDLYYSFDID